MNNVFIDWPFHLAGTLLALLSAFILYRSLLHNRSRGRRRCPKCWYDMSGADASREKGLVCPECGHDAKRERRLLKTRRRWGWAVVGLVVIALSYGAWKAPDVRRHGWVGVVPTWALLMAFPHLLELEEDWREQDLRGRKRLEQRLAAIGSWSLTAPTPRGGIRERLILESLRRYASGEMRQRQASSLAYWALREQGLASSNAMDTRTLRRIAMHGVAHGHVSQDRLNRWLGPELVKCIATTLSWAEHEPIHFSPAPSELLGDFAGKCHLVVSDHCGESHLAWTNELPSAYFDHMTMTTKHVIALDMLQHGFLCPQVAGAIVKVRVELWCTATKRAGDEDYWLAYAVDLELTIEIGRVGPSGGAQLGP